MTANADEAIATVAPAKIISSLMIVLSLAVGAIIVFIVSGIRKELTTSITELRDGADQVSGAASQVSSLSQSLARGASEQAASLEETSASSEEINSMARKNIDNSRATAELLTQSQVKVAPRSPVKIADRFNPQSYLLKLLTCWASTCSGFRETARTEC